MSKIPKILLYSDSYNDRVGVATAYVNFFSQFGEVILVGAGNDLPFFIHHGDILAIPGGADVDSQRYGEFPRSVGRLNPHYEYLDEFLLKPWIETGKPIIGICRGMQSLNVTLGGSLHQDIYGHIGGEHRWKRSEELYTDIKGYHIYMTNSYHHQAVKQLGEGLEVIGWSSIWDNCPSLRRGKDNRPMLMHQYEIGDKMDAKGKKFKGLVKTEAYYAIPEIIKHKTKPYIGFQYHPEEFNCELAVKLLSDLMGINIINNEPNDTKEKDSGTEILSSILY